MTNEQFATLARLAPWHATSPFTASFLAETMGVSARHVRRVLRHPVRTRRQPWNRLSEDIREQIILLKREHASYNCQWISELVSDHAARPISRSSVWRILRAADLLRDTPPDRTPRTRFSAEHTGDLVQMDTTMGFWLNGERVCCILLLDDASRYILTAEFFWEEARTTICG